MPDFGPFRPRRDRRPLPGSNGGYDNGPGIEYIHTYIQVHVEEGLGVALTGRAVACARGVISPRNNLTQISFL